MKEGKGKRSAGFALFCVYLLLLIYILFFWFRGFSGDTTDTSLADYARYRSNFVPLRTIRIYWTYALQTAGAAAETADSFWHSYYLRNLAGNLVLFLPMGIFLPLLFSKLRRFWRTLLTTALIVVCVEGLQLLTRTGSCDVDDLILNLLGCAAGYLLWFAASRLLHGKGIRTEG